MPLPRLAAYTIERERISAWLIRHAGLPLRLLLAPAGSGKTTALALYARMREERVLYLQLKYRADGRTLEDDLCDLADLPVFQYSRFLSTLAAQERTELIVDGIDHLTVPEEALLERIVYDAPEHVSFIYAGTASTMGVHRLEAAGLACVLPREQLLFTPDDIRALCEGLGVEARRENVIALRECCSGWPAAVADVLRCAVDEESAIVDAYGCWLEQRGRTFAAFVREEIGRLPDDVRELFEESVKRDTVVRRPEGDRLEQAGAFVTATEAGIRPYNVIGDLIGRPATAHVSTNGRLSMRMFGRFSLRSGDREVTWIRRRDQQIFRFIALRPGGRVTKSEIVEIFWPDADPHLAAQSLRTACSNIRKALASVMDPAIVERLFVTEGQELIVNPAQIVVDVRRFKAHMNDGNEAESDARPSDAFAHYHAANRLYRADLFSGEPEEAWFVPQREIYRELVMLARERIASLRTEIPCDNLEASGRKAAS